METTVQQFQMVQHYDSVRILLTYKKFMLLKNNPNMIRMYKAPGTGFQMMKVRLTRKINFHYTTKLLKVIHFINHFGVLHVHQQ